MAYRTGTGTELAAWLRGIAALLEGPEDLRIEVRIAPVGVGPDPAGRLEAVKATAETLGASPVGELRGVGGVSVVRVWDGPGVEISHTTHQWARRAGRWSREFVVTSEGLAGE